MAASKVDPAQQLLDWYQAMGVDEAIGDTPVNHFAPAASEAAPADPRLESKTSAKTSA